MQGMILAAGVGTRLRPLTDPIPKPMVPILNTPVMAYSVRLMKQHGIQEIVANTYYHPEYITNYFGSGKDFGVDLHYSLEKELLGTAGGVRNNRSFFKGPFFVLSGDALTDINLTKMLAFHRKNRALATIALKPISDVSHFGVVVTDQTGRIQAFQEKPKQEEALSNVANTGIYLFEPEILDLIPEGFYDFGRDLFPLLLKMNVTFYGYVTKDYWSDIGTIDVYRQAHRDVLNRPGLLSQAAADGTFRLRKNCITGMHSTLDLSVKLGNHVFIGRHCNIGRGVKLDNCIIWDNTIVAENAVIQNAVLGAGCYVGRNAVIRGGSLIGNYTRIGDNVHLDRQSMIEANSILPTGRE